MTIAKVDVLEKYKMFTATGQVDSSYKDTVSDVYVGISCTSKAGAIVGGGYTFMQSNVVGGASAPFSTNITVTKPPAKCTGNATLSNISEAK
jgi:hypothetical protein